MSKTRDCAIKTVDMDAVTVRDGAFTNMHKYACKQQC